MGNKTQKQLSEFDLLAECLAQMEQQGINHNLLSINFDDKTLGELNHQLGTSTSLEELHKLVDRCLANSWLEHTVMGAKYNELRLTTTGFGAAKSRQRRAEMLQQRSRTKKVSDYVVEHRGLFMVLGFLLALASFTFTIWRYVK